MKIIID